MNETIRRNRTMTCGSYEAEIRKYIPVVEEDGSVWLIADQPNMADNMYYCNFDPKSQGFARRTLHFVTVDGDEIDLPAPWHSNSQAFKERTGIDITDTHLTYGLISKGRKMDSNFNTVYVDVLYKDKEPTLGQFHRVLHIAKRLARERNEDLFCYSESQGGSSSQPVSCSKEKAQ